MDPGFLSVTYCGLSAQARGAGALTSVFEVMADLAKKPPEATADPCTVGLDELHRYKGQDWGKCRTQAAANPTLASQTMFH